MTLIGGSSGGKGALYTKSVLDEHDLNLKEELGKLDEGIHFKAQVPSASSPAVSKRHSVTSSQLVTDSTTVKSKMCAIS